MGAAPEKGKKTKRQKKKKKKKSIYISGAKTNFGTLIIKNANNQKQKEKKTGKHESRISMTPIVTAILKISHCVFILGIFLYL